MPDTKTEEGYPAALGVYCDAKDCEVDILCDYLVRDSDTQATRFEYARKHMRSEGWLCNEDGDLCPKHAVEHLLAENGRLNTLIEDMAKEMKEAGL